MQFRTLRQEVQMMADHSPRHMTLLQQDRVVTEMLELGWEIQSIIYPVTDNKAFMTRMIHFVKKED